MAGPSGSASSQWRSVSASARGMPLLEGGNSNSDSLEHYIRSVRIMPRLTNPRLKEWPLVWIHLATSGMVPSVDIILEISCVITDAEMKEMVQGPTLVIHHSLQALQTAGNWINKYHRHNGIIPDVLRSRVSAAAAGQQIVDFVKAHTIEKQYHLAGDRTSMVLEFLETYMPPLGLLFRPVLLDVGAIRLLYWRWKPGGRIPPKSSTYRARDVKLDIGELLFYKENLVFL